MCPKSLILSAEKGPAKTRRERKWQINCNRTQNVFFSWGLWLGSGNLVLLVSVGEGEKPLRTRGFSMWSETSWFAGSVSCG